MVANALWCWLQQEKKNKWHHRGKPIWAAALWQDIAARVENLVVKVPHVDAHVPKSWATEEHENNQQVDQAAQTEVAQVDLDWQHKGELFTAQWGHDTSGRRDTTYRWAHDQGVDLAMDTIAQVIHECATRAAIKQAKRLKPLVWKIDYITLPQTHQGKRHVLTMVETTTEWLETYPMPHATSRITILGLENQVLWRQGTPERIESDNGTHFQNNLLGPWAKERGIEWKGEKTCCTTTAVERGVRICERNNSSDTKVSEEGGGGGVPGVRAEIPLRSVVKTMVRQAVPLQPMVEQISTCSLWRTPRQSRWRPPKEVVALWEAHAGADSWQDLWTHGERSPCQSRSSGKTCDLMGGPRWSSLFLKDCTLWKGPMLEQFMKNCSPWEGLTLEKFMEDCLPWETSNIMK
ncbi:LOW QUALITY PROTEIN: hypothetical protein QYF61_022240 [Mycteria americana]|uniref:Integrase catalytic domain-containing protein n=1 Tax=Mycteria americana TaxID=33587 RepID=A0AAN7S9Q3_MYCAM|nr:LOW QUALITY PROTEIN: hypothetical protein QYF61_022240 [Mycteria americana]